MTNQFTDFQVTDLDLSGVSNEDLGHKAGANNTANSTPWRLRKEGRYDLTIVERTLLPGRTDGAGKQWATLSLLVSTGNYQTKLFIDVPRESLIYTSKAGVASKVKTQIFTSFLNAITNRKITTTELPNAIANLYDLTVPGTEFAATLKYRRDHVVRNAEKTGYNIRIVALGAPMTDLDGNILTFTSYEEANGYYQSVMGFKPASNLEATSFGVVGSAGKQAAA